MIATATISSVAIVIEVIETTHAQMVANETRPASFATADTMLAFNGYRRTAPWNLGPNGTVTAPLAVADNRFAGVTAARLWERIGTTHGQDFLPVLASEVEPGWLITDQDHSEVYLVAGQSVELETAKIHMVGEGQVWDERFTGEFHRDRLVWVSKPKG